MREARGHASKRAAHDTATDAHGCVRDPGGSSHGRPFHPIEDIAQAYLVAAQGDAGIALRCAITDALSDLLEAQRRTRDNSRLISRGYVRQRLRAE